jgi:hypothetical protein
MAKSQYKVRTVDFLFRTSAASGNVLATEAKVFAKPVVIDLSVIRPDEATPSEIMRRLKGQFWRYCTIRYDEDRCKADLLEKIINLIHLHHHVEPGSYTGPIYNFADLQRTIAALYKRSDEQRKNQDNRVQYRSNTSPFAHQ